MSEREKQNLIVLGAGPIGLETALYARALGYTVSVYERGRVAENVLRWGHVRLFSPWSYNVSPLGRRRLDEEGQTPPDASDDFSTGREFAKRYLMPLANLPELRGQIHTQCEAIQCGRTEIGKSALLPGDRRAQYPFRLLIRHADGAEEFVSADVVIDTTGVFGNHNWLGEGGIPAAGESAVADKICYELPDILGADRERYAGKTTAIIGNGFSSATCVVALEALRAQSASTNVVWICRKDAAQPISVIADDPLPERARLARQANALAKGDHGATRYLPGRHVQSIGKSGGQFQIDLRRAGQGTERIACDNVIANVGYHPDARIYRQLHVHECYATLGPIDLAASLLAQGDIDCLAVKSGGADLLKNPEPNFYILGAKSFGANSSFLMRLGHEQIAQVFQLITGDARLNLYESESVGAANASSDR